MSWTNEFFGKYYLKTHLPLLTEDRNETEVGFLLDILDIPKNASILDMPCGFGRHSLLLGEKGYKVTGVDIKTDFTLIAQNKADEKGLDNVKFITEDMKKIKFKNEFDVVLNLFTSFGYFENEGDNFESLRRISRSLKKGGKFVIDTLNREWVMNQTLNNNLNQVWILYPDNTVFLANNKFDFKTGRWSSDQIIVDKGERFNQYQDIRLYSYSELEMLFNLVGMRIVASYGDFDKDLPYEPTGPSMILVAEKVK